MNKLIVGIIGVMLSVILATGYFLFRQQPVANPSGLLGIPLPNSAANIQVDVQPHFIDGYDAYLRFDIAPEDLDGFLSDPAIQPSRRTDNPLSVFWNAIRGSTPMEQIASASRPGWWQPEQGDRFLTAYRARLGPGGDYSGPDSAWYIIDKSDSQRYTVYVFVSEI
jgi:hypothetical protein